MPEPEIGRDMRGRLTQVAVEDFLRDTLDLEEVARMTADNMYKDLYSKVHDQVREIISGLNIPQEIRAVTAKVCQEVIPGILERNVPSMVQGLVNTNIGWYKERIESLSTQLQDERTALAEESSKRRKVHRAHVALLERVNELEERLKKLEPQDLASINVEVVEEKKGLFNWSRKKKPTNQGAEYI